MKPSLPILLLAPLFDSRTLHFADDLFKLLIGYKRLPASAAPSGEAAFDFGIPEEKPAPAPAAAPLDGYAPLSLDFLDDADVYKRQPVLWSDVPGAEV